MDNFFTLKYWIKMRPGALDQNGFYLMLVFLAILLFLAMFTYALKGKKNGLYYKIWSKSNSFSFSNFLIGLLLLFFMYEEIPLLSARVLLLVWGIGMIAWLGFIIKIITNIPKVKERLAKELEYKKYLP